MIPKKNDMLTYLLFITIFVFISCSDGGSGFSPNGGDDSADINETWEMVHYTEWISGTETCEEDSQTGTNLYWKIEDTNKLTKYVKVNESLGGMCNMRTYTITIGDNTLTVIDGGESGEDKSYRFQQSGNALILYDDEESVEGCQEKLEFSKISDLTEFESIVEDCISS